MHLTPLICSCMANSASINHSADMILTADNTRSGRKAKSKPSYPETDRGFIYQNKTYSPSAGIIRLRFDGSERCSSLSAGFLQLPRFFISHRLLFIASAAYQAGSPCRSNELPNLSGCFISAESYVYNKLLISCCQA
jgi:hypothetical protein